MPCWTEFLLSTCVLEQAMEMLNHQLSSMLCVDHPSREFWRSFGLDIHQKYIADGAPFVTLRLACQQNKVD